MWTPQLEQERRLAWAHSLERGTQEIKVQMYRARGANIVTKQLYDQLRTWTKNNVDNFQVTPESVAPLLKSLALRDQSWEGLSQLVWLFTAKFGAAAAQMLMVEHPQSEYFNAQVADRQTSAVWEVERADFADVYVIRFAGEGRALVEREMTQTIRGIYRKGWVPVYVNWERQFAIAEYR